MRIVTVSAAQPIENDIWKRTVPSGKRGFEPGQYLAGNQLPHRGENSTEATKTQLLQKRKSCALVDGQYMKYEMTIDSWTVSVFFFSVFGYICTILYQ